MNRMQLEFILAQFSKESQRLQDSGVSEEEFVDEMRKFTDGMNVAIDISEELS